MNLIFRKIKITKTNGVVLQYVRQNQAEAGSVLNTDVVEKSPDEVHPDFKKALQAFAAVVVDDEGYQDKKGVVITGLSLFNNEETVIVTHTKEIKSGVTARNSGRISLTESESGLDLTKLSKLVKNLIKEAKAYVDDNKRAQLTIFDAKEAEKPKEDLKAVV